MYDELIKRLRMQADAERFFSGEPMLYDQAADAIEELLKAEVRPVVLCRDCKHNMANIPDIQDGININENWNACQLTELYDSVKPDDFCSRGKKKGES